MDMDPKPSRIRDSRLNVARKRVAWEVSRKHLQDRALVNEGLLQDLLRPAYSVRLVTKRSKPDGSGVGRASTVTLGRPSEQPVDDRLSDEGETESLIAGYLLLYPVLWVSGLAVPSAGFLLVWLVLRGQTNRIITDPVAIPWYLLALVQAFSVIVNWGMQELPLITLIRRLMSPVVVGWAMFGFALAVGRNQVRVTEHIRRATCVFGLYIFIGAVLAIGLFAAGFSSYSFLTPIGHLLPASLPATDMYFTAHIFTIEPQLDVIPRLRVLYPWSVMVSFCSLIVLLVAAGETARTWRWIGMIGGFVGLLGGQSRIVLVCFLVATAFYIVLRWRHQWVVLTVLLSLNIILVLVLVSEGLVGLHLAGLYEPILNWRGGSTEARMLGYEASWSGFLASPILGHGWPGEQIDPNIPMFVGSHSSIYGLLYTGGLISFGCLMLALVMLLGLAFRRVFVRGRTARAAAAIVVTLPILGVTESLFSYGPALMPFLVYFGAAFTSENDSHSTGRKAWY